MVMSSVCSSVFSFQIFNAARQLSHIEAAPDKSGLVLLDYWVSLKRCPVIIHNQVTSPRHGERARPDTARACSRFRARVGVQPVSCRILTIGRKV